MFPEVSHIRRKRKNTRLRKDDIKNFEVERIYDVKKLNKIILK